MEFNAQEIEEFKVEAYELLENAEKSLLAIDTGEELTPHYDAIFRALHSIKGAAGMMEMTSLQSHMHQLENIFTEQKGKTVLSKELTDFFLRGLDGCRTILGGGTITFSYEISSSATPAPMPVTAPTPAPVRECLGRVIVLDDEAHIVEILTKMLESAHLEAIGTTDPADALSKIEKLKPNALISDVAMPSMDGFKVLEAAKKIDPDLPVIFLSAQVNKDNIIDAISKGIFSVIEKPFDMVHVVSTCKSAVRKHKLYNLLNSSINLLMYQFSDLDAFLKSQGKDDIRTVISNQITDLLSRRRSLRSLGK